MSNLKQYQTQRRATARRLLAKEAAWTNVGHGGGDGNKAHPEVTRERRKRKHARRMDSLRKRAAA